MQAQQWSIDKITLLFINTVYFNTFSLLEFDLISVLTLTLLSIISITYAP